MDKQHLSRSRQWLIERCQFINFGSLSFHLVGGEPDLLRPHHVSRTVKFVGGEIGPRTELAKTTSNFARST